MAVQTQHYTVEEFERFTALPENAERRLELIGGEIIEVVANSYSSIVTLRPAAKPGGLESMECWMAATYCPVLRWP